MIDYDSDSFLLRNMIGVVWYLHMFFDNIELDGTDVDVQDRVSRDGYSSTTGVQLFVFLIFSMCERRFWWLVNIDIVTLGVNSH